MSAHDHYLDIPHYSQLDSSLGINGDEARSVCAIVCLMSVVEYETGKQVSFAQVRGMVVAHGGKHELGGWRHDAMVATLRDLGLVAWRRNWRAPSQDPHYLAEHEHYNESQMKILQLQMYNESVHANTRQQEQASILDAIRAGHPVIVSVRAGFSKNAENHLILIHGYKQTDDQLYFYVTDPIRTDKSHQTQEVSANFFFDHFNERGIFVTKN